MATLHDAWGGSWGTAWGLAWTKDLDVVATPETFSGGYPTRSKKKKTGYELAMEGLARMEYVKPQMRKPSVIEPTNVEDSAFLATNADEDDIAAIMLLIH